MIGGRSDGGHEPGLERDRIGGLGTRLDARTSQQRHRRRHLSLTRPGTTRPGIAADARPALGRHRPGGGDIVQDRGSDATIQAAGRHGREPVPGGQAAPDHPGDALGRARGERAPVPAPAVALHRVEQALVAGVVHAAHQRRGGELADRVHQVLAHVAKCRLAE